MIEIVNVKEINMGNRGGTTRDLREFLESEEKACVVDISRFHDVVSARNAYGGAICRNKLPISTAVRDGKLYLILKEQ